jgi:hypothetical protein
VPKFKNVSSQGALDLPLIGRVVQPGEVIEVTAEQAKHLAGQDAVWQPVGRKAVPLPAPAPDAAEQDDDAPRGEDEEG